MTDQELFEVILDSFCPVSLRLVEAEGNTYVLAGHVSLDVNEEGREHVHAAKVSHRQEFVPDTDSASLPGSSSPSSRSLDLACGGWRYGNVPPSEVYKPDRQNGHRLRQNPKKSLVTNLSILAILSDWFVYFLYGTGTNSLR